MPVRSSGNFPSFNTTGGRGVDEYLRRLEARIAKLEAAPPAKAKAAAPDSNTVTNTVSSNGGIRIGQQVLNGTASRVLYESTGPLLADSSTFTFDDANGALVVVATDVSVAKAITGTELSSSTNNPYSSITSERRSTGAIAAGYEAGYGCNVQQNATDTTSASTQWGALTWGFDGAWDTSKMIGRVSVAGVAQVNWINGSNGQFALQVAGAGYSIKEGSNCKMGQATLSGGTKVVANTSVTANSRIFLSGMGVTNAGELGYTLNAGVGFTIGSSNASDARVVSYVIFEPT